MKSIFASLTTENVHQIRFHTREEAKVALFNYIEVIHNRQRLHSGVGYRTPVEARQHGGDRHACSRMTL